MLMVDTLQLSLDIWNADTGKSMLDLAQESKIWGIHLDRTSGTWRSRTLKNYLSVKTLPNNPRINKVIQTAKYILENCPTHQNTQELQLKLDELMTK